MKQFIAEITTSIISHDFQTVLTAASGKDTATIDAEINAINVLQTLERLNASPASIPAEAKAFLKNPHLKFILGLNAFCQTHIAAENQRLASDEALTALKNMSYIAEEPIKFATIANRINQDMPTLIATVIENSKVILDDGVTFWEQGVRHSWEEKAMSRSSSTGSFVIV
ncbi:MAG: hypothetical protein ACHP6I_02030 [Rickettsiales bacterium]